MGPQALAAQEEDDYLICSHITIGIGTTTNEEENDEWPKLLKKAQSMIVAPSLSLSSPWVQANETAPMITHCHLTRRDHPLQPPPRPVRRVRSRSFNDRFDEELEDRFHPSYSDLQQASTVEMANLKEEGNPHYLSILYGLINTCVVL